MNSPFDPFDGDPFAATRMSFGGHLEELRFRLIRALLGVLAGLALGLLVGREVIVWLTAPLKTELAAFYRQRVETARQRLVSGDPNLVEANRPITLRTEQLVTRSDGEPAWEDGLMRVFPVEVALELDGALRIAGRPPVPVAMTVTEGFVTYFMVSLSCGVVLASPWIFYQAWMFVAAGLYPHERRLVHVYLPLSIILFFVGIAVCVGLVLPGAVSYLLSFNAWLGLEPDLRLGEWVRFAVFLPVAFGIAFQTPLVMGVLHRVGLATRDDFRRHRKAAWLVLAVFAAIITVTPDYYTMLMLTVPLWGLYETGILLCAWLPVGAKT